MCMISTLSSKVLIIVWFKGILVSFKRAPPCCGSDERSFRDFPMFYVHQWYWQRLWANVLYFCSQAYPISWGFCNPGFYLSFASRIWKFIVYYPRFPKAIAFFCWEHLIHAGKKHANNASNHQVQNILGKDSCELTNPLEKSFSKGESFGKKTGNTNVTRMMRKLDQSFKGMTRYLEQQCWLWQHLQLHFPLCEVLSIWVGSPNRSYSI